jgi:hypothetical protein
MSKDKSPSHYVVQVDVKHVINPEPVAQRGPLGQVTTPKPERVVEDTAHLVFRSGTLEGAIEQAKQHLGIMSENSVQDWADGGSLT